MKVSAIIVTLGVKDYLKACVSSLLKQTQVPYEIIVIDNSQKSKVAKEIGKLYPGVKIFSSSENLFYARALNKGIEISKGEFVLCLNDDLILDKEFIQQALIGFSVNKKVGAVSGKILRFDGKILDSTGLTLSIFRTAKERGYGQSDLKQFEKNGYIFGVNGAAAFFRKKMLEEIKDKYSYFDSRFNMFYEDLDVAWRANKSGWQAYYVAKAITFHLRGGSFRPDSGLGQAMARRYLNNELHYELIKNRYLTVLKNEDLFDFLLHLIPMLIYDVFAWGYIIFFRPKVLKIFLRNKLSFRK